MKPMVDFGLGVVVGTVLGAGLAILFAPVSAPTARWVLLPPDLAAQHPAGGRTRPPHPISSRTATVTPSARQDATARDTDLAAAKRR